MAYVLINGRRYYQDERGNVMLDNVSQAEADRREREASAPTPPPAPIRSDSSQFGFSGYTVPTSSPSRTSSGRATSRSPNFFGRRLLTACVALMVIGTVFCNQSCLTSAEQAITEYIEKLTNTVRERTDSQTAEDTLSDYLLPNSDQRYLEADEIRGCSPDEIQMMINEIYARHGLKFGSQHNRDHFEGTSWYCPVPGKTEQEIIREFNHYEWANLDLLVKSLPAKG